MKLKFAAVITWLCFPVYIWQGLGVRRNSVRQSPPLPQYVEPVKGSGKPYRLLLIGDSSAAGVGVDDISNSLSGYLVKLLAERSKRPVEIEIIGSNSATASQIRDHVLPHIAHQDFTHVILTIGTNDAKNFHTARRFYREFGTLLYAFNARFPSAQVIWSGIIDMSGVPALPSPLNKILGIRSQLLMQQGERLCRERMAEIPSGIWETSKDNFASDGFHASEKGYREWAKILVGHIVQK